MAQDSHAHFIASNHRSRPTWPDHAGRVAPPARTVGRSVRRLQKETYWFYVTGFWCGDTSGYSCTFPPRGVSGDALMTQLSSGGAPRALKLRKTSIAAAICCSV